MKTGLACFGLAVAGLMTIVVSSILSGWVLSVLWEWFVVPTFSVSSLSIPVAIGISLVIGMLTKEGKPRDDKKKDTYELVGEILGTVFAPLVTLIVGWIVYSFV